MDGTRTSGYDTKEFCKGVYDGIVEIKIRNNNTENK